MPSHLRLLSDVELQPPPPNSPVLAPDATIRQITGESGEVFYLVSLRPPGGGAPIREFVVDPYTWGWVALKIAEGVLGAVGAKVFNEIFGGRDFTAFQAQLLEKIAAIVKAAIAEDAKRQMEVNLYSLQNRFRIYLNTKDVSDLPQLLALADHVAIDAWSLQLPAVASFAIVGGLELAILQEIHQRRQTDGDKTNVADIAIQRWRQHADFPVWLDQYNQSRFSPLWQHPTGNWLYALDGQWQGPYYPQATAARVRDDHIRNEYARLEQEVVAPLYPVAAKWREIAIQYGWQPTQVELPDQ